MTVSCYSEKLAKTGVIHYGAYASKAYQNEVAKAEQISEEMSYDEEMKEYYGIDQDPEVETQAATSDEVAPEDIYHGLDSCCALRKLGGEDSDTARKHCLQMFSDPNIKAAFENDAAPGTIGLLLHQWNVKYDPRPGYAGMRRFDADRKNQRESSIDKIKEEIRHTGKFDGKKIEWLLDSDLTREATKQFEIRQGRFRSEQRKQRGLDQTTVGCLYKKDKKTLIAEAAQSPRRGYTTVGNLYGGKTQVELAQEALDAEVSSLDRCVKMRMEIKGEEYKTALETCKYMIEEGHARITYKKEV